MVHAGEEKRREKSLAEDIGALAILPKEEREARLANLRPGDPSNMPILVGRTRAFLHLVTQTPVNPAEEKRSEGRTHITDMMELAGMSHEERTERLDHLRASDGQLRVLDSQFINDVWTDLRQFLPVEMSEVVSLEDTQHTVAYAAGEFPHARAYRSRFAGVPNKPIMKGLVESTLRFRIVRSYLKRTYPALWSNELSPEAKIALLRGVLNVYDIDETGHGRVAQHCNGVAANVILIGEELGMSPQDLHTTQLAARIHDFGKVGMKAELLNRPDPPLTGEEWVPLFTHPGHIADLLDEFGLTEIAHIIRHYHERFDGQGYPRGVVLGNGYIPSQILSAADSVTVRSGDPSHSHAKPKGPQDIIRRLENDLGQLTPRIRVAAVRAVMRSVTRLLAPKSSQTQPG